VAVIGSFHDVKLIMYIPIKTANQHFTLYRVIALPMKIGNDKFVLNQFDFQYFALESFQREYALLSEADLLQCFTNTVTVCPVHTAFYDARTITCVSSLFPDHC
jgi:hypothetical protein